MIPIFAPRLITGQPIEIFGDGEQTRHFVNVNDVVRANYRAGLAKGVTGAFNIASGTRITINELTRLIGEASGLLPDVEHKDPRPGDVRHSLADISAARNAPGYHPSVELDSGLKEYMAWAKIHLW